MGKINYGRVVLGGLLAGLVISVGEYLLNEVVFAEQMAGAMTNLGLSTPGGEQIAALVVMTFVVGIALVWVYAAIRPRFGAGIKTAIIAGVVTWLLNYCLPNVAFTIIGIVPTDVAVTACLWGLVEVLLAAVAGAWLYKESA
jgi:hypothetical protein